MTKIKFQGKNQVEYRTVVKNTKEVFNQTHEQCACELYKLLMLGNNIQLLLQTLQEKTSIEFVMQVSVLLNEKIKQDNQEVIAI